MKCSPGHYGLPLSLLALLLSAAFQAAQAQSECTLDWSSSGGSSGISTGGVYSVSRAVGWADSDLMHTTNYTVAGSFWSGTVILPEFATSGFYVGIDLHDPAQALADFDGDGFSTLLKFALGANPRNPVSTAKCLQILVTTNTANQFLTMQFKRRVNASTLGLQYIPEVSTDGQNWFSDGAHVLEVDATALDTQFDWVTVRDQTPTTSTTPRFLRLRLVEN